MLSKSEYFQIGIFSNSRFVQIAGQLKVLQKYYDNILTPERQLHIYFYFLNIVFVFGIGMANCPPPFSLHLRPLFVQLQYNYTLHMLGTKFFLRTKQLSTYIIYVRLLK